MKTLPPELAKAQHEIQGHARSYGLDFFELIFEVLDWNQMNMVAAYGGFPNRYPHWKFGMEYDRLRKSYSYGLSKIYEMVINTDPCYAYLLHSNNFVDQKMVMAHVHGHCDFFKNNVFFAHTNRKMIDEMANHKTRILRYIDRYTEDVVEAFIDAVLSLENLIDIHSMGKKDPRTQTRADPQEILNEPKWGEKEKEKTHLPERPTRDVLQFLTMHAPLEDWQRDIISILREEAYYFAPQAQTKVLNEGWASFWHSKMMTEKILTASEVIDYADHHSGTMAMQPGQLNPYKLGIELFREIEDRWNKGRFGKEYDECQELVSKEKWDRKLGLGREKIFEVRRLYNDVTFIDTFLTPEFCYKHKMFVYAYNISADQYEIASREFEKIKKQMLFQMTNFGHPMIDVIEADHRGKGELLLKHRHEGVDLKTDWAKEALRALHKIWKSPVSIETVFDGIPKILSFDGQEHQEIRP